MSPSAAIQSPFFQAYSAIALVLLVTGGLVLQCLRRTSTHNVTHAWNAYRGWLVMVPAVLGAIFLGRVATIACFTLLAVLATREFARATSLHRDRVMTWVVYATVIACGVVSLMRDPFTERDGWYGMYMALPVFATSLILIVPIVRNQTHGQLQTLALAILAFVYIGWMFGHLAFLANAEHAYAYLLYLLFAVELNDVAAYMFGRFFGRRALRSNISPKKTWAGSLGAVAVSFALPWVLYPSLPDFRPVERVLTALIVGVGGQLGDLSISVIKRDLDIKDMGNAIVGHGGVLDRIDSMIFVAPLFFHMTRFFHDL